MSLFRTSQIVLFTRDIDRAITFYSALGFEEAFRTPAAEDLDGHLIQVVQAVH